MKRTRTFSYMQWLAGLTLPANRFAVLFRLCEAANDEQWCWPGFDTLAKRTQLSRRTVITELQTLETDGLLVIEREPGKPNRYQLLVARRLIGIVGKGCTPCTGAPAAPVQTSAPEGVQMELLGGAPHAPEEVTTLQETTTTKLQENARGRAGTARGEIAKLMRRASGERA